MMNPTIDPRVEKLQLTQASEIKGYALHTGDSIELTQFVNPLGVGGSSVVFKVFQILDTARNISVPRALKLFVMREDLLEKDASTSFLPAHDNFLEEIKNISQFSHENLIQVIDAGEHDFTMADGTIKSVPFLVTHLITGCTLREVIEGSPNAEFVRTKLRANPEVAIQLVSQMCRGLSYLHHRDFLHCDIAPKNIFIEDGQHIRAIVGDVGMSRKINGKPGDKVFIAGTRSYSPEGISNLFGSEIDTCELVKWFPIWDLFGFSKSIMELFQYVSTLSSEPWINAALLKATQTYNSITQFKSAEEVAERVEYCLPVHRERGGVPELEPSSVIARKRMMPIEALTLTKRVDGLVRHPAITRLQGVPQLTVVRSASPGGTHTRYEHALGVMENVRRMLSSLIDEPTFLGVLGRNSIETGLVAGLLYNASRFPFSNVIHELNKRLPPGENKIFSLFGRASLFNDIFGIKFISHRGLTLEMQIRRDFPAIDLDKLMRILTASSTAELTDPDETILYALLNSSLDARVIDFVRRDSLHLGLSSGNFFELDDLLPHLIISPGVSGNDVGRVSLKTSGIPVAEQIILMRYWLFQRVYWNQPNRAYIAAIRRAFLDMMEFDDFESELRTRALLADEREMLRFLYEFSKQKNQSSTTQLLDFVVNHEKILYRGVYDRNLRLCDINPIKQDRQTIETIISKTMSYQTMRTFENKLAAAISAKLSISETGGAPLVLLDVPFEPGNIKLGTDIFVQINSSPNPLAINLETLERVSPVIEGVNKNFINDLQRLRIFVRPDVMLSINDGEWLYDELRRLVN